MSPTFSYFTIVGPRTVLYGNDYKFYLTYKHDGKSTAKVDVAIESLSNGEEIQNITIDLPYNIDIEEQYTFNVINLKSYQFVGDFLMTIL